MRILNWNIEHMNSWWPGGNQDPPQMRNTFTGNSFSPPITDVPGLAQRVGNVISAIDPDIVTIQEGAGIPEMNDFFNRFVNGNNWEVLRGSGGGQALVTVANMDTVSNFTQGPEVVGSIDLNEPFNADINTDLILDEVAFARKPQVTNATFNGHMFTIINNHLKSKFVQNGEALFNAGGESRMLFFDGALRARRRISGEAFRIREFIDAILGEDPNTLLILAGDLNDGAGADFFERNFLTHSVVDRIFGSIFNTDNQLRHVLFHGGSTDYTAQFFDFIVNETRDLVLDHIGLSPAIYDQWNWTGRVAVAEYENEIINLPNMHERDRLPSDHRPVVVNIDVPLLN